MFNFAHFIPGTLDADYLRQQVSERGVLEKIDALNELVKQCLSKDQSMSDFYRMIADIEDNLNRNMNDPRARNLINTFTKEPIPEDTTGMGGTTGTDNTTGSDNTTDSDNTADSDNTTGTDDATGSDNTTGTDNTAGSDNTTGMEDNAGADNTTDSDNTTSADNIADPDNTAGTKPTTKRGTRKSKDAE